MAVYVTCPKCYHPAVVSHFAAGQYRTCRQCQEVFPVNPSDTLTDEMASLWSAETGRTMPDSKPLPDRSGTIALQVRR